MKGFLAGFGIASLLWGLAAFLYFEGFFAAEESELAELDPQPGDAGIDSAVERPRARQRRRRRRPRRRARHRNSPRRSNSEGMEEATTGDDLGPDGPRQVDLESSGGEERLSSSQIDQAMGRAMPGIRRCLLLLPSDQQARGRAVFGIRINGSGRATRVRLTGPRALVAGEVGSCMRRAVRSVVFPTFDGPEMTVSYPITFE